MFFCKRSLEQISYIIESKYALSLVLHPSPLTVCGCPFASIPLCATFHLSDSPLSRCIFSWNLLWYAFITRNLVLRVTMGDVDILMVSDCQYTIMIYLLPFFLKKKLLAKSTLAVMVWGKWLGQGDTRESVSVCSLHCHCKYLCLCSVNERMENCSHLEPQNTRWWNYRDISFFEKVDPLFQPVPMSLILCTKEEYCL